MCVRLQEAALARGILMQHILMGLALQHLKRQQHTCPVDNKAQLHQAAKMYRMHLR